MTDTQKTKKEKSNQKRKQPNENLGAGAKVKDPIAYEIKRAREERNLTISDLSRLTGISRPVLFGYEDGRTKPGTREIRLISDAIKVSPNRLLFGKEEPFEIRKGLSPLVQLAASNPAAAVAASMMIFPIAAAVLNEEEKVAFLSLLGAMIEARDKDAFRKIRAFTEIMAEAASTPEKMAELSELQKDPAKLEEMQAKMKKRYEELE